MSKGQLMKGSAGVFSILKGALLAALVAMPALAEPDFNSPASGNLAKSGTWSQDKLSEDARKLCEETAPAYAGAFRKGGMNFIPRILAGNQQYKNLDTFQQRALFALLGQFSDTTTNEEATRRCYQILNMEGMERIGEEQIEYCESWSRTVFRVATLQTQGELDDADVVAMAGENQSLRQVINQVRDQADRLAEGVEPETLARAYYYTCLSKFIEKE